MCEHEPRTRMQRLGWSLALCLTLGLTACTGDDPADDDDAADDDDDDDTSSEIDPASVGGSAVLAAHAAGELTDGEAALALTRIFFGLTDAVEPDLLAAPGDPEAVHTFLWSLDPETFSDDVRDELIALGEAVSGATVRETTPLGDFWWCLWGAADGGRVRIYAPMDVVPTEELCDPELVLPNAAAVAGWVWDAADAAAPVYREKFDHGDVNRDIYIFDTSPADWGSTVGMADYHSPTYCRNYVTATPPLGTTSELLYSEVVGTVIHELFHCAQDAEGLDRSITWVREGTAVWAEDYIEDLSFPGMNSEHRYVERFLAPGPWLSRSYDASNAIIQLSERINPEIGFQLVSSWDAASLLSSLPDFGNQWHTTSVSTWNEPPVDVWTNDGLSLASSSTDTTPLEEDDIITSSVVGLAEMGYHREAFELDPEVDIVTVEVVDLPGHGKLSLIEENGEVVELAPEAEHWVCIEAVGKCHETEPVDATKIGLVTTNVDAATPLDREVSLDSHAPQLHGSWRMVSFASSIDGASIQSGSIVDFEEPEDPDAYSEDFGGSSVFPDLSGNFSCTVSGTSSGEVASAYLDTQEDAAEGTLSFTPTAGSPSYSCEDANGNGISGAAPGLWLITQGPWAPVLFQLDGDDLTVISQTQQGVSWTAVLERI